jgi:Ni,Fe-hydrogenase I large subunit
MKKIISVLVILILAVYVLVEFVGDSIIKGSLESNITNTLDRKTTIGDLNISYLSGSAEIEDLKIQNKDFPGHLILLKKASAKLNTSSIFSDKIEIDEILINGVNLSYYFIVNNKMKINDNVKSLQKILNEGSSTSSNSKKFIIKDLKLDNIVISAKSEKLNLDKSINFENLEFKNIGNTKDSKDYKTVLKETINKAMKDMKNKVLRGNVGNALNKVKNIDQDKIKEKIKKELFQNKDKVKNKLKKLLNKN